MALVLTVYEGEPFYVGDTPVYLEKVISHNKFSLRVKTPSIEKLVKITDQRSEEILPGVKVSAGFEPKVSDGMLAVKVVIDAPKNKKILREKLYLEKQNSDNSG